MYDGLKIKNLIVPCIEILKSKLDVSLSVNPKDGEILNEPKKIDYNGLQFEFKDKYINVRGSIHKYWNNGEHNYNDFIVSNLLEAIKKLEEEFEINLFESRLNNIEFGVNIIVPFNADKFLDNLILHKGKYFTKRKDENMTFYEFIHSKYIIKIYNKGKQYRKKHDITEEIIRFEIKVITMQYLHDKDINIEFISDLLDTSYYHELGELLLKTYDEILMFDETVNIDRLKEKHKLFYLEARNSNYWMNLIENYESFKESNKKKYKALYRKYNQLEKDFRKIISNNSRDNKQQFVRTLIAEKWTEISTVTPQTQSEIIAYLESKVCSKSSDKVKVLSSNFCSQSSTSIYSTFDDSLLIKLCIVTGLNKPCCKGKYLSKNDVKFYAENNTQIFENLKQNYFKPKKDTPYSLEKTCYLIAHNIRNSDTNYRNNLKRQILKSTPGPTLFNKNEYLILKDEHKKQLSYWNGTPYEIQLNGVL